MKNEVSVCSIDVPQLCHFGKNAPAKLIHENVNERAVLINVGGWLYVTEAVWYAMGNVRRIGSEKVIFCWFGQWHQKMSLYLLCHCSCDFVLPNQSMVGGTSHYQQYGLLALSGNRHSILFNFIFWQKFTLTESSNFLIANVSNLILRQCTLAGCSIGHKLHPLLVNKWDLCQTKK